MVDARPLVSIGMPVYNGERFIRHALDSLLAQDYAKFELIISDNASMDGTQEICMEYAARDKRVRYYPSRVNMGAAWNANRVFELSSGEYFMLAGCHDLWARSFISKCVGILNHRTSVVLCYPLADWIDINGEFMEKMPCGPDTCGLNRVSRCNVVLWGTQYAYPIYGLIRANALKKAKFFGRVIGSDVIMLFELSMLGEFEQIPEVLLHIRRMPDYGSWDSYIEKFFNNQKKGLSRRLLFWKMLFEYLHVVHRHIRSISEKVILIIVVFFSVIMKYRWIRRGLRKKG
jgi:glycosyltransferase involved in cell wall biosynthesis